MRRYSFLILVIVLSACIAHPKDCARFRDGKFSMRSNDETNIIERKGGYQTEYIEGRKDSTWMTFNIKWLNDYTYTIDPTPETRKKYKFRLPKYATVTVEIIHTTSNSYIVRMSDFTGRTLAGECVKID